MKPNCKYDSVSEKELPVPAGQDVEAMRQYLPPITLLYTMLVTVNHKIFPLAQIQMINDRAIS